MPNLTVNSNNYTELLVDVKKLINEGQQIAVSAVNSVRLNTYWKVGKRISDTIDSFAEDPAAIAADYFNQLSIDLQMDKPLLYRINQFYKTWPTAIPSVEDGVTLSWSHIVELLSIKNEEQRTFYFETASKEDWARTTLRKAIQKDYFETIKTNADADIAATLKRDKSPLYVYKAWIQDVVDGDTLVVRIDLGFEVAINERVRFRGINTAELTKNGVPIADASDRAINAKEFVQEKLKDIPFIVIKTYKTDKFGRFIADIFYSPTLSKKEDVATKGFFLNEELLQAGLADLMM